MKNIIELLLDLRISPRISFFDEDRGKNQAFDIDQISTFEGLGTKALGISINCDRSEMAAIAFKGADEDFMRGFYEKCGVSIEYKWVVSTEGMEIVYFRVSNIPKNFGSEYHGLDLIPKQGSFDKMTLVTKSIIPFAPLDINGKTYSFKNGVLTKEDPLKEISFNSLVSVLAEFSNINDHTEKLAQKEIELAIEEDSTEHIETPLLPFRIYDKLPKTIQLFVGQFKLPREKDISLLSLIVVLSACLPNVVSRHRNKKIWSHLYLVITAGAASGKGVLADVLRIISKIEKHYRDIFDQQLKEYKNQYRMFKAKEIQDEPVKPTIKTILLPTDNSFIALFEQLCDNGGSGLMFETEIDTFINAGNQEWANYGLLNRKATHHEPHVLDRKTLEQPLYLASPKIAMVMGGTPNQFFNLFKSIEDGLFSRHLVYSYQLKKINIENPFTYGDNKFFDDAIEDTENFVYNLFMSLIGLDYEIEFQWTEQQAKILHSNFTRMFENAEPVYGEGTASVVLRYMLAASRIGMVLSAVEASERGVLHSSKMLIANDRVMDIVIGILETCSQHSFLMMTNIKANSKTRPLDMKSMNMLRFYGALPDGKSFKTKEAIQIGRSVNISGRSVGDYLPALCKSKHLDQISFGVYRKAR